MLQLCAARGDVVALLNVPVDFETDACVLYGQQLAAREASDGGDRTLSYGALFHPWLIISDTPSTLTTAVPDGSIAGIIAARAIQEGAWYSPANQLLNGVLGLAPPLPASSRGRFFAAQLNLIEQEPRGFIAASSATLSGDSELTEFTVRRLLILLRRLVLRDGMTFVFESNDSGFQRRVRRQFEDLLRTLYVRGAFAGASQDQAFRVVADGSVNTQDDIDNGRFIVELRVAPSRPLAFLTVRLVQAGGALTVSEGN
jgi:phage tail sheath protein FI